jgi:hypothetical protein
VSTASNTPKGEIRWLALALATVACTVLPFLLIATPAWDGWPHYVLALRNDQAAVVDHMVANGRPLGGWVLWQAMVLIGPASGPKWLMCGALAASAGFFFLALRTARLATPVQACAAAVLATCLPAVQTVMGASMTQFLVGHAAFSAGLWLFLLADRRQGAAWALLYGGAVVLAVAAVLFAEAPLALLPLYPALLVAGRGAGLQLRPVLARWPELLRHSVPVVAGGAALTASFALYPAYGTHEGAHALLADAVLLARNAFLYGAAVLACSLPLALVLALYLGPGARHAATGRALLAACAFGAVVLVAGLLPYWLSGRLPSILGWGVRMLLFSGFGLALMALGVLRVADLPPVRQKALVVVLCVTAALNVLWRLPPWAVRQALDDAVMAAVAADDRLRQPALLAVRDPGWVISGPYRSYEWTAMVQRATGRDDILALAVADTARPIAGWIAYFQRDLRLLGSTVPDGRCSGLVDLPALSPASSWQALQGLVLRWSGDAADYGRWLASAMPVTVTVVCEPRR